MKLFIDSADPKEIEELAGTGLVDGRPCWMTHTTLESVPLTAGMLDALAYCLVYLYGSVAGKLLALEGAVASADALVEHLRVVGLVGADGHVDDFVTLAATLTPTTAPPRLIGLTARRPVGWPR